MLNRRTKAFTLVEILMVVVILGIMSAIIIPQLGGRSDLKTAAAARMIMADLAYAQSQAIATQRKQYVQFSAAQYTLLNRASDGATLAVMTHPINPGDYVIPVGTGALADVAIAEAVFGTTQILAFDELGSPMQYDPVTDTTTPLTSPGTIRIQSGDHILTISIEPYTGEMSVS